MKTKEMIEEVVAGASAKRVIDKVVSEAWKAKEVKSSFKELGIKLRGDPKYGGTEFNFKDDKQREDLISRLVKAGYVKSKTRKGGLIFTKAEGDKKVSIRVHKLSGSLSYYDKDSRQGSKM